MSLRSARECTRVINQIQILGLPPTQVNGFDPGFLPELLLYPWRSVESVVKLDCGSAEYTPLYRWIRAEPPLANARTCSTVAMLVSPGKVVSSAPWAQPRFTASCSVAPESSP